MLQLSSLSLPVPTQEPWLYLHRRHSQSATIPLSRRRFSPTSAPRSKLSFKCQYSERSTSDSSPTFYPVDSPPPPSGLPPRVFVGHSIYKGKAALTVEPKAPEFMGLHSGSYKLSREGFVLLQFAPAAGLRIYDWGKKQVFSLSVSEIGTLIGLSGRESCEFFHDPQMGRSDEGQIRKILKVEPLPDGSGYFFNISVQNKPANVEDSIYIPVTKGEYAVLKSALNFILPYLMGWHAFANHTKPEITGRVNNGRYGGDSEWSRVLILYISALDAIHDMDIVGIA